MAASATAAVACMSSLKVGTLLVVDDTSCKTAQHTRQATDQLITPPPGPPAMVPISGPSKRELQRVLLLQR